MLNYTVTFFILAVAAAFFGFGGLAADFAGIAKLLTIIFVILLIASVVINALNGRKQTPLL